MPEVIRRLSPRWSDAELYRLEWMWKNSQLAPWQIADALGRNIEAPQSKAHAMGWRRTYDPELAARAKLAWQYDDPDWIDEEDLEAWERLGEPKPKLRRI